MGFCGEQRCTHCGSECHVTEACPPAVRAPALRTCTVYARGETTEYVLREDHDRTVRDAQMKIGALELALRRKQHEIDELRIDDWQGRIEAIQRRYEAELDLYRVPPGFKRVPCDCGKRHSYHVMADVPDVPFHSIASLGFKCDCGAVCSSRANLLSHVRTESKAHDVKVRARHIAFAAALDVLYPA